MEPSAQAEIGQRFERWTVIRGMTLPNGRAGCVCVCECGTRRVVPRAALRAGASQSCGCRGREILKNRVFIHGHTGHGRRSRLYRIWANMKARCLRPNNKDYPHYGGRGIRICKRWLKFENFLADMGEPPTEKHSLDRINNDGNYTKKNCRWATMKEQRQNTRLTVFVEHEGRRQTVSQWADELGKDYGQVYRKLFPTSAGKKRWTMDEIIAGRRKGAVLQKDGRYRKPFSGRTKARMSQAQRSRYGNVALTLDGRTQHLQDWAAELGIQAQTIHWRMSKGWSEADCLTVVPGTPRRPRCIAIPRLGAKLQNTKEGT